MADYADNGSTGRGSLVRTALWSAAGLLLVAPAVAMQVTDEVNWTGADFVFAAVVFGTIGLVAELTVRATGSFAYRAGVAFALAASFVIVWANAAVGMIGDEGNPYNLYFFGAIALALAGSAAARFRAGGMTLAMAGAGAVQAAVAAGGFSADPRGAAFSLVLSSLWLISAGLFRKAARDEAGAAR